MKNKRSSGLLSYTYVLKGVNDLGRLPILSQLGVRALETRRGKNTDTMSERSVPHGPNQMWPVNKGVLSLTNKKWVCMLMNYIIPSFIPHEALFHFYRRGN